MKNQTTCSDIQYRRVKPQGGRRENKRMEAKGAKTSVGLHTSKFAAGVRALFCSPLPFPSRLPLVQSVLFILLLLKLFLPMSHLSSVINPGLPLPLLCSRMLQRISPPSPYSRHLINTCIIKPVFVCACVCTHVRVCVCVRESKHMHLFCLQVVLRVSEYHKWTNRDNRGERGRKGGKVAPDRLLNTV